MARTVPTISGIERTTAVLGGIATATLYILGLPTLALACAAGSAVMIVNFFLLAAVGGGIVAIARGRDGASRAAIMLAPLKLFFLIAAVYALVSVLRLNVPGFVAGILTQFVAIFIETWRTSPSLVANGGARTQGNHF